MCIVVYEMRSQKEIWIVTKRQQTFNQSKNNNDNNNGDSNSNNANLAVGLKVGLKNVECSLMYFLGDFSCSQ